MYDNDRLIEIIAELEKMQTQPDEQVSIMCETDIDESHIYGTRDAYFNFVTTVLKALVEEPNPNKSFSFDQYTVNTNYSLDETIITESDVQIDSMSITESVEQHEKIVQFYQYLNGMGPKPD